MAARAWGVLHGFNNGYQSAQSVSLPIENGVCIGAVFNANDYGLEDNLITVSGGPGIFAIELSNDEVVFDINGTSSNYVFATSELIHAHMSLSNDFSWAAYINGFRVGSGSFSDHSPVAGTVAVAVSDDSSQTELVGLYLNNADMFRSDVNGLFKAICNAKDVPDSFARPNTGEIYNFDYVWSVKRGNGFAGASWKSAGAQASLELARGNFNLEMGVRTREELPYHFPGTVPN